MNKIHTHYDNLKIAKNAPPEIIRAAYRALSQKFHPDKNPGDVDAARIMTIINGSYEVLSDPIKRQTYDAFLDEGEQQTSFNKANSQTQPPKPPVSPQPKAPQPTSFNQSQPHVVPRKSRIVRFFTHLIKYRGLYFWGVLAAFFVYYANLPTPPPPVGQPYNPTPPTPPESLTLPKPPYVRPDTAPNGSVWPSQAAYIPGYKKIHTRGLSSVTIDNSQNDSDVFVKLVSIDGPEAYPVRVFYIPAYQSFTSNKVKPGTYDIRHRDLKSGELSRSESFMLEEIPTYNGTEYSTIKMTLYKMTNGNMQTYPLSETEF